MSDSLRHTCIHTPGNRLWQMKAQIWKQKWACWLVKWRPSAIKLEHTTQIDVLTLREFGTLLLHLGFLLPDQVGSNHGRAEISSGLDQTEGKDRVLQSADGRDIACGRYSIERVKQGGHVCVVHRHILLFHLLQDVHCLWDGKEETSATLAPTSVCDASVRCQHAPLHRNKRCESGLDGQRTGTWKEQKRRRKRDDAERRKKARGGQILAGRRVGCVNVIKGPFS